MLKISPQPTQSINFSMNKEFNITNGLEECYLTFKPIATPILKDGVYIFLTYKFSISSLSKDEDFKLEMETLIPFELSPLREITTRGLYQCAIICQEFLQEMCSALFKGVKTSPK